jgi:nucleotide-binding universal stress UspA family protein
MKQVLVALDFSEVTEEVVERAAVLAESLGARLWMIHAAAPEPDFVGYDAGPEGVRDRVAEHLREEHRDLQARAETLRERGIDARALLVQGPTVEVILREAEKLGAELIVLGSHGHGAVFRALLGSTSEGVLHKAQVPVLIVPAHSGRD